VNRNDNRQTSLHDAKILKIHTALFLPSNYNNNSRVTARCRTNLHNVRHTSLSQLLIVKTIRVGIEPTHSGWISFRFPFSIVPRFSEPAALSGGPARIPTIDRVSNRIHLIRQTSFLLCRISLWQFLARVSYIVTKVTRHIRESNAIRPPFWFKT